MHELKLVFLAVHLLLFLNFYFTLNLLFFNYTKLQTVDGHHNKVPENQQWRKHIEHPPPIHQFCVDALFSDLMLQVNFCAPWEQWHHNWRTPDKQRRKPFALISLYHQLIVQFNKIFFVCRWCHSYIKPDTHHCYLFCCQHISFTNKLKVNLALTEMCKK